VALGQAITSCVGLESYAVEIVRYRATVGAGRAEGRLGQGGAFAPV